MSTVSTASQLLKNLSPAKRLAGKILLLNEGAQGLSHLKFAQDTMSVWAPKALVSRSLAEVSELSLLEFVESFIVYYSMPLSGQKIFQHLAYKASKKGFDKSLLAKPLKELTERNARELHKILPVKAAVILATLGFAAIGCEYVLNFAKNLFTSKVFRKEQFSDVVNLSGNDTTDGPVAQKAHRRIRQALGVAAGVVAASLALARFGPSSRLLQGFSKQVVRLLDFSFSNGRFGLSRNQLLVYMGIAVAGYMDAARDGLERKEIATRLALVLPYLLVGQEILQRFFQKFVAKKAPDILQNGQLRGLEEIAARSPGDFSRLLGAKSALFFVPMAVGILAAGIGVGLLNRFWTAHRFQKARQEKALARPLFSGAAMHPLQRKSFEQFTRIGLPNQPSPFVFNT